MTRLAVSSIAWDPSDDDAVADVLRRHGAGGVELAPTKWRERPLEASSTEVAALRRAWNDRGLEIVSLQSLLFGRPDLQLFGGADTRAALADYLERTMDLAAALAARVLVFGSPKNRVKGELPIEEANTIAVDFFRDVGARARARGVVMCIEANPPAYGCDFITSTAEAVALARAIDHPGIAVNGDLGGMTMGGEDPEQAIAGAGPLLGHFHASEPELAELGTTADHGAAARELRAIGYDGWVSIEMRAAGGRENVAAVERAVRAARSVYVSED